MYGARCCLPFTRKTGNFSHLFWELVNFALMCSHAVFLLCRTTERQTVVFQQRPIHQHFAQQAVGSSSDTPVMWRIDRWTPSTFLTFSSSSSSPPLPLSDCVIPRRLHLTVVFLCSGFNKETNHVPITCKIDTTLSCITWSSGPRAETCGLFS